MQCGVCQDGLSLERKVIVRNWVSAILSAPLLRWPGAPAVLGRVTSQILCSVEVRHFKVLWTTLHPPSSGEDEGSRARS